MAECFAQSTLKCGREVPRAPGEPRTNAHTCTATAEIRAFTRCDISASLAGSQAAGARDAAMTYTEREGDQEAASRAGHVGLGGYKRPSTDDE